MIRSLELVPLEAAMQDLLVSGARSARPFLTGWASDHGVEVA
jgi:hypothetical protein